MQNVEPQHTQQQVRFPVSVPDFDLHRVEESLRANYKLFNGTPLSEKELTRSVEEFRMFLQRHKLAGTPEDFEKPSAEVDRVWYTHMCETQQYYQDCMAYFGQMFHHSNATCDMKPKALLTS